MITIVTTSGFVFVKLEEVAIAILRISYIWRVLCRLACGSPNLQKAAAASGISRQNSAPPA